MNRKQRRRSDKGRKRTAPAAALLGEAARRFDQGRPGEALDLCLEALEAAPDDFAVHANLGNVYLRLGQTGNAIAAYEKSLALAPGSVPVLSNLAILMAETADYDGALSLYRRILAIDPGDAEAYHDLALIKTFEAGDPDVAAMEALLAGPSLDADARMYLGFALTKAYDELGDYRRAFAHAADANRIKRAGLDYDVAKDEAMAARIIAAFDNDLVAGAAGGCEDEAPVFIVGMPRSGTTLVEQIVASHSRAHGMGEVNHLRDVVMGFGDDAAGGVGGLSASAAGFPEGVRDLTAGGLARLGAAYARRLGADAPPDVSPGALRVTDKMPRNFFFLGLVCMALPRARIVHCRRHPVATCLSCFRIHFPTGQAFTYDLRELGRYYRLYDRLMGHWRAVAPERVFELRYEDLVADTEAETRRLLDFLGLPFEDACLRFHESRRRVGTASAHQVRRPVYATAVEHWRRYEADLGPLMDALGPLADSP